MPRRDIAMRVSIAETEAFRRLVEFAAETERYADEQCDVALQALVHELHDDLRQMYRGE